MATLAEVGGWRAVLGALVEGTDLTDDAAQAAVAEILAGEASPAQIGGFLAGLQAKGVSPAELAAMVDAMLAAAMPLELDRVDDVIDIVGTGGSRLRQDKAFNISTTACFVVAGAGAHVCKHGNRKATSTSGSFDLLEALGVAIDLDGAAVARCVVEAGAGFCFARAFHPAMRHAGPVRSELGIPTVFNFLGPLSNPARISRQVIGVNDPAMAPTVIGVLQQRGAPRAMVVHGHDGMDELTITGRSTVWEIREGSVSKYDLDPRDLGIDVIDLDQIAGGDAAANAAIAHRVFAGEAGPHRDIITLNAAAGLLVSGVVDDLESGLARARQSIDSGGASAALERLVAVSNP